MISAGSYLLSALLLAVLVLSLGFSAVRLRQRLMPEWEGAPARLVEAIVGVALLIWLAELLGVVSLLYAWTLVGASVALAVGIAFASGPGWGRSGRVSPRGSRLSPSGQGEKQDAASYRTTRLLDNQGQRPGGTPPFARRPEGYVPRRRRCRCGCLRALGPDDGGCAEQRDLQLRFPLVPPAVRGGHGSEPLRHRLALHRDRLHQLVLPAELGAAARRRDPDHASRHAVAVPQLRLAGDRLSRCLVRRQAVRAWAADRGRCWGAARVSHACGARAGSCQERSDGRSTAPRRHRDPGHRCMAAVISRGWRGGGVPGGRGVLFFAPTTISDGRTTPRRKTQHPPGTPPPRQDPRPKCSRWLSRGWRPASQLERSQRLSQWPPH